MLAALLMLVTIQATQPESAGLEARGPTPPIDTKALALRLEAGLLGHELRLIAELRRHPRRTKRPGTSVSAQGVEHADERGPRTYRSGERARILGVRRDRAGILIRIGPPGHDAGRLLPGGDTSSSVRIPPPLNEEAADTYDLFEKSARYAEDEARKARAAKARMVTILLTGATEEDYRKALAQVFALPKR